MINKIKKTKVMNTKIMNTKTMNTKTMNTKTMERTNGTNVQSDPQTTACAHARGKNQSGGRKILHFLTLCDQKAKVQRQVHVKVFELHIQKQIP